MQFIVNNLLLGVDWIGGIFLKLCMRIDAIIYRIVAAIYDIFMALCKMDVGALGDVFTSLKERIFLLLGIIMLFVVSFNLLKMLVDPSKATDSRVGGAALAKHIFISIIMLIAAPFVFDMLREVQTSIVENDVIGKIVLGGTGTQLENGGPKFSWMLFSGFFYPNKGSWDGTPNVTDKVKKAYDSIYVDDNYDLSPLADVADDSTVTYIPIVSTVAGIIIVFQLVKFSISVGVRAFKFLFLEIIAPIPIISYMDPGKGSGYFSKYVSEVISTFIDLFLKIATLFLAILLASKVTQAIHDGILFGSTTSLGSFSSMIAKVLIIIALFQFADKVPEVIGNIFNIKIQSNGGFTKGLAAAAGLAGGAAIGGAGAFVGSAMHGDWTAVRNADGTINHAQTASRRLSNFGKVGVDTLGGIARGGVSGGKSGFATGGINTKLLKGVGAAGMGGVAAQMFSSDKSRLAGGFFQKQLGRLDSATGGEYRAKARQQGYSDRISKLGNTEVTDLSGKKTTYNQLAGQLNTAESKQKDLSMVRNTITQEYAKAYGVDNATAAKYFEDNSGELENFLKSDGANNNAIQAAFNDYNQKYGLEGSESLDYNQSFDSYSAGLDSEVAQLHTKTDPITTQIKGYQKQQETDKSSFESRQELIDKSKPSNSKK